MFSKLWLWTKIPYCIFYGVIWFLKCFLRPGWSNLNKKNDIHDGHMFTVPAAGYGEWPQHPPQAEEDVGKVFAWLVFTCWCLFGTSKGCSWGSSVTVAMGVTVQPVCAVWALFWAGSHSTMDTVWTLWPGPQALQAHFLSLSPGCFSSHVFQESPEARPQRSQSVLMEVVTLQ